MTEITYGMKLTPPSCATAIAIGNISTPAALLVISSVRITVATYSTTSAQNGSPRARSPM